MAFAAASGSARKMAPSLGRYVALFGNRPPAGTLEAQRLQSDLRSHLMEPKDARRERQFDTNVSLTGRDITVRVHRPMEQRGQGAICYFHGGAFAYGSTEMLDVATSQICEIIGMPVVSVHYRRLPQSDVQGLLDDCLEVYAWLRRNADLIGSEADQIALSGDSVGAFLALKTALEAPDHCRPSALLLFYGAYALGRCSVEYDVGGDPLLTQDRITATANIFRDCGGDEMKCVFDHEAMRHLPPTHVVAAELDPLAADSHQLVQAMERAGVAVTAHLASGMIHGFARACGTSAEAQEELRGACEAMLKQQAFA